MFQKCEQKNALNKRSGGMTKNEWSLLDMFLRWARDDINKLQSQIDNLETLIKKLEPTDDNSKQPRGY